MTAEEGIPPRKGPPSRRSRLLASIGTRSALRQAIVVAEILAPPVAIRNRRSAGQRQPRNTAA